METKDFFKAEASTKRSLFFKGLLIGLLSLGFLGCSETPVKDVKIFHGGT